MQLQHKVALVTGAADERSIGWGIVKALADEGAGVVLNDLARLSEPLEARADQIRSLGQQALAIVADVSQPAQVNKMISEAVDKMGRLDIAVSNAGIIRWEHFLDITPQNLQAIVNVNLKGNMYVCQAAARQMIKQEQE